MHLHNPQLISLTASNFTLGLSILHTYIFYTERGRRRAQKFLYAELRVPCVGKIISFVSVNYLQKLFP